MTICQSCFAENLTGANVCKRCQAPLAAAGPMCKNGHPMDPTWTECNYCRAEAQFGSSSNAVPYRPTVPEGLGQESTWESRSITPTDLPSPFAPAPPIRKTSLEVPLPPPAVSGKTPLPPAPDAPSPSSNRKTTFLAPTQPGAGPATAGSGGRTMPKIVGVLVTYTWKPEGEIFPIREGRNRLGRGGGAECDITLPQDDTMSSIHSSITFRSRFVISDLDSMSGTYVNGKAIEEASFPLENYDEIRTGSTVWTLVLLQPTGNEAELSAS